MYIYTQINLSHTKTELMQQHKLGKVRCMSNGWVGSAQILCYVFCISNSF